MDKNHFCYNCIHCNEIYGKWWCTINLVALPSWGDPGGEGTAWEIQDDMKECDYKEEEKNDK